MKNAIIFLLLASLPAVAQCTGSPNCTVKAGGGGGYTTIQACVTAMANGDTCTVFAGTYTEDVTVTAGGVGNYKTITINSSDIVSVYSFHLAGSHIKILGNCPTHTTIGTCGFSIQHTAAIGTSSAQPCFKLDALVSDSYIVGNVGYGCGDFQFGNGGAAIYSTASTTGGTFNVIRNNTFSYTCSLSSAPNICGGIVVMGSNNLIEGNDLSHVTYGFRVFGQHNVVRNNIWHDINGTGVVPTDCGSNSSNCHMVFLQQDADTSVHPFTGFTLLEGNTELNGHGNDTKVALFQAENCAGHCSNAIVRFNVGEHIGSGTLTDDNSQVLTSPGWSHVKSYNNTWADVNNLVFSSGGESFNIDYASPNGAGINDIYYYTTAVTNWNPIGVGPNGTNTPFKVANNLAFCTGSNCLAQLHNHTYGSGSWTDDPGNIYTDPKFVNYAGNDFHIQAGSPALGAGTSLTTAVGAGVSSTLLTVADADYFQDGAGITGVQADWIRIGASTTAQISSVNYSTNVITLATAQTWSNGAAIYLYKDSSGTIQLNAASPNIGYDQSASGGPVPGTQLAPVSQWTAGAKIQ